jgi:uncharacterized protein YndB with AHSA1/START domain
VTTYHLVTRWSFQAPVERVWEELGEVKAWAAWMPPGVWKATVRGSGPAMGVGTVADSKVRGFLPYTLRFSVEVTASEPPTLLEVRSSGDLVGEGRVALSPRDGGTAVTILWDVRTTQAALNLLGHAPFVKPLMEKNHAYVMGRVYRALRPRVERSESPGTFG